MDVVAVLVTVTVRDVYNFEMLNVFCREGENLLEPTRLTVTSGKFLPTKQLAQRRGGRGLCPAS